MKKRIPLNQESTKQNQQEDGGDRTANRTANPGQSLFPVHALPHPRAAHQKAWPKVRKNCTELMPAMGFSRWPISKRTGPTGVW